MDRFQAMQVFVRVVDANSFTRAADSLSLPRTTVTTIIQNLERLLGVRLLNRTTRRIGLTPDGAGYYQHCVRILADVEETEACFQEAALRLKGRLRIDVPTCIGRLILIPSLCDFHDKYPDVELVLGLGDRPVDMVQEAVDCVIRSGDRRIPAGGAPHRHAADRDLRVAVVHLAPRHAADHRGTGPASRGALLHEPQRPQLRLELQGGRQAPGSRNEGHGGGERGRGLPDCGLKGFGLIQTPRYMALPHLQSGELIEVLPQWKPGAVPMSILYPQSRQLSPKVRAFADWVAELFASCPLLSGRDETDPAALTCGVFKSEAAKARLPAPQPARATLTEALLGRRSAREEAAEYALADDGAGPLRAGRHRAERRGLRPRRFRVRPSPFPGKPVAITGFASIA